MAGFTSASMHHVVKIEVEDTLFPTFTSRKYIMTDAYGNHMEIIAFVYKSDAPLELVELPVRDVMGST